MGVRATPSNLTMAIDLTKYEGHTEGPWHFCLGYDIESDTYTGINPLKGGGDRVNGPVILSEYQFAKGTTGHRADMALITDAPLLLAEVKRLYAEPRMTIDEWNTKPEGPCVTVYMDGCEYVGCLRLYKNEDGEVIE